MCDVQAEHLPVQFVPPRLRPTELAQAMPSGEQRKPRLSCSLSCTDVGTMYATWLATCPPTGWEMQ